jgi:hypothetical protein
MKNMMETTKTSLFIQMAILSWQTQNARVDKLLNTLTDDQLLQPTAPERNTGAYILGHLITVSDGMLSVLGLSDKLYPRLQHIFLDNPENAGLTKPSIAELKAYWHHVNETLQQHFTKMTEDEWFGRHMAVTEEDFAREPHRNKLNILLNRTNHQSYHIGQLVYLQH